MTSFERIKFYYDKGWCNKEQLRRYVVFNVITPEEYTLICGEVF